MLYMLKADKNILYLSPSSFPANKEGGNCKLNVVTSDMFEHLDC